MKIDILVQEVNLMTLNRAVNVPHHFLILYCIYKTFSIVIKMVEDPG